MKKFLLSCAAVVAVAFGANAQLYLCGNADGLGWEPDAPMVVDAAGGNYTFTLTNATAFKMSTAMGTWDDFNAGAVCIYGDFNAPGTYEVGVGTGDIVLPWVGDWTFVVNTDLTSAQVSTTTTKPEGFTKVYVRGGCNGWGVEDAYEFTTTDGVVYTLEVTDPDMVAAMSEPRWKIADANWAKINFESANPLYVDDDPAELLFNAPDQNMYIEWEGADMTSVTVVFNYNGNDGSTVQVLTLGTGIEGVAADVNAPAVYFNLQGVQVANPENGLYIVKQGNKVSKVLVK